MSSWQEKFKRLTPVEKHEILSDFLTWVRSNRRTQTLAERLASSRLRFEKAFGITDANRARWQAEADRMKRAAQRKG